MLPTDEQDQVARYWSSYCAAAFEPEHYWSALPAVRRRLNEKASGSISQDWIEHCVRVHLAGQLPVERALSLGCGDGWLSAPWPRGGLSQV